MVDPKAPPVVTPPAVSPRTQPPKAAVPTPKFTPPPPKVVPPAPKVVPKAAIDPNPQPMPPTFSGKDVDFPAWVQADMRYKKAYGAWMARKRKS